MNSFFINKISALKENIDTNNDKNPTEELKKYIKTKDLTRYQFELKELSEENDSEGNFKDDDDLTEEKPDDPTILEIGLNDADDEDFFETSSKTKQN